MPSKAKPLSVVNDCPQCGGTHIGSPKGECPIKNPPAPIAWPKLARLKCPGCGRDGENAKALVFYLNRAVTNDEMRFLHEVMQRAVATMPGDYNGR